MGVFGGLDVGHAMIQGINSPSRAAMEMEGSMKAKINGVYLNSLTKVQEPVFVKSEDAYKNPENRGFARRRAR